MPPPNITVPPNTAQRGTEHFSSTGSQLPNSLNINMNLNQGQFNQTQSNRTGPPPVSLQQHLQQPHFNNLNTSLAAITTPSDASAIPSTLSGISVSQFNSSFQNHTQMTDAFKPRQISVSCFTKFSLYKFFKFVTVEDKFSLILYCAIELYFTCIYMDVKPHI